MFRIASAVAASALALTLAPLSSPSARAATDPPPTDGPLVVDAGAGARVVVEQSPFHLKVTDASGNDVLDEVAHAEPGHHRGAGDGGSDRHRRR